MERWLRDFRITEPEDGCAVGVLAIVFAKCGLEVNQEKLALKMKVAGNGVYNSDFEKFCKECFNDCYFSENNSVCDLDNKIKGGYLTIVGWTNDILTDEGDFPEGHYSIIANIWRMMNKITIVDPSSGIYSLSLSNFERRWHETEIFNSDGGKIEIKHTKWAGFIKPESVKRFEADWLGTN